MNRFLIAPVMAVAVAAPLLFLPLAAQEDSMPQALPVADTSDVRSLDAVIAALYDVISGPAGQARDWDRFRSLFAPQARLIPTNRDRTGTVRTVTFTPDDYVTRIGPTLEERGFFEDEIGRVTETFGSITHAFSAYQSRWKRDDPGPFQRGINSIQLLDDGERWWIVSIFWDAERPDNPIPARYLGGADG